MTLFLPATKRLGAPVAFCLAESMSINSTCRLHLGTLGWPQELR
jgi:hypothetical protein